MKNNVVIILARGGSKGIPKKNIMTFCGKPLLAWSIKQAKKANGVSEVWVSSDDKRILSVAKKYGSKIIQRPKSLATNTSSSVSGYLHAIEQIEKNGKQIDSVMALQATSPIRESSDIENGLKRFYKLKCDSMFSASLIGDFFIWRQKKDGSYNSINYNYRKRPRRQDFAKQYVENGSFYIFKPVILKKYKNQLGGKIGITIMEFWKSFEIDDMEDRKFCEIIMKKYLQKNVKRLSS